MVKQIYKTYLLFLFLLTSHSMQENIKYENTLVINYDDEYQKAFKITQLINDQTSICKKNIYKYFYISMLKLINKDVLEDQDEKMIEDISSVFNEKKLKHIKKLYDDKIKHIKEELNIKIPLNFIYVLSFFKHEVIQHLNLYKYKNNPIEDNWSLNYCYQYIFNLNNILEQFENFKYKNDIFITTYTKFLQQFPSLLLFDEVSPICLYEVDFFVKYLKNQNVYMQIINSMKKLEDHLNKEIEKIKLNHENDIKNKNYEILAICQIYKKKINQINLNYKNEIDKYQQEIHNEILDIRQTSETKINQIKQKIHNEILDIRQTSETKINQINLNHKNEVENKNNEILAIHQMYQAQINQINLYYTNNTNKLESTIQNLNSNNIKELNLFTHNIKLLQDKLKKLQVTLQNNNNTIDNAEMLYEREVVIEEAEIKVKNLIINLLKNDLNKESLLAFYNVLHECNDKIVNNIPKESNYYFKIINDLKDLKDILEKLNEDIINKKTNNSYEKFTILNNFKIEESKKYLNKKIRECEVQKQQVAKTLKELDLQKNQIYTLITKNEEILNQIALNNIESQEKDIKELINIYKKFKFNKTLQENEQLCEENQILLNQLKISENNNIDLANKKITLEKDYDNLLKEHKKILREYSTLEKNNYTLEAKLKGLKK